jgi:hypothetical protein
VNQEAAASAAALRQTNAAESAPNDVPQPLQSGAKKAAVTSAPKGAVAAPVKTTQFDVRAKTPSTTFLTGVGLEADEDELAKVRHRHRMSFAQNTRH